MDGGGPRSQIFWGGSQVSDFLGGGSPVSIKGKIFDTRFGLIHVQTGEKNFLSRDPPPSVKGKIFDTRFGLIHVQTGEEIFCRGTTPPHSKKLLWLRGGRYASCVNAGGLSCYQIVQVLALLVVCEAC